MNARPKPQTHEVVAAVTADVLCPVEWFYSAAGGRTAFQGFRAKGLPVRRWQGRPCVRPSDLREFQTKHAEPLTEEANGT